MSSTVHVATDSLRLLFHRAEMCVTLFLQSVKHELSTANAFNSSLCLQALLTQKIRSIQLSELNLRRDVNSKNNKHWSTVNTPALHRALNTIGSADTFRILMDLLF